MNNEWKKSKFELVAYFWQYCICAHPKGEAKEVGFKVLNYVFLGYDVQNKGHMCIVIQQQEKTSLINMHVFMKGILFYS
jgi:hypothetical protein